MDGLIPIVMGLVALSAGGESLVRGSSRLAGALGIPRVVVGLTVVAIGTSAPELAVGIKAALAGRSEIVVGNVVGSNILNVLLVLGVSALILPLVVDRSLVRRDAPLLVGVSGLVYLLVLDGSLGRLEGAALLAGGLLYLAWLTRVGLRESRGNGAAIRAQEDAPTTQRTGNIPLSILLVVLGGGALVLGSRWLVDGATGIAQALGVSELVIGLTVVAIGTSLPEIATSVIAAICGERDIAVGNVVGSNLFNLLLVLGASATLSGGGVEVSRIALRFDLPVMLAAALACLPVFFTGSRISRGEGGFFLGYYLAYLALLVATTLEHPLVHVLSRALWWFAAPLTLVALCLSLAASLRSRPARAGPILASSWHRRTGATQRVDRTTTERNVSGPRDVTADEREE